MAKSKKKGKSAAQKRKDNANKKLKNLGNNFKYNNGGKLLTTYNNDNKAYNSFLNNAEANGYNKYIGDVNSLFDQVMSAEKFSYDPQKDALFQMYKNQYHSQGQRAMQNQMGVASAYSGGYNSSVAQTSAQSQYQNYMNELSDKTAETYKNALDLYKNNQQNLLDRYNAARDMNNAGNEAYWQKLGALGDKAKMSYDAYNDDRSFQYNSWNDNRGYWQDEKQNAQTQMNWQADYNQTEKWNKKNYNLQKKGYKGK